ncbi:protein-glucosylgalactosylhydroxylysine glucosidase isoform X2 [Ambystoma mexicanum]
MSDSAEDPRIFTSSTLPSDPRYLATVANGYLGTRIYGDVLHVSGVYNGAVPDCHRAILPSPVNVKMSVAGEELLADSFSLNTQTGTFTHILQCPDYTATQQIFAHRSHAHLMVCTVAIKRQEGNVQPITVSLQSRFKPESQDLNMQEGQAFEGAQYIYGTTLIPEVADCPLQSVHMIRSPIPQSVTLSAGEQEESWDFFAAVADTEEEVKKRFSEGLALSASGELWTTHEKAWEKLWEGGCIDAEGPLPLRQALYGCLYYLLSSLPPLGSPGLFSGISPGGLSNGQEGEDYWGHAFWDQDTWMYPNILLFHPDLARVVLEYRIRTLTGALANATKQGYKGAKFPWESAVTGCEVCPEDLYGAQEVHINGDVLLAFQQYFYVTQDLDIFSKDGGWDLVSAIATYWCSRVQWNEEEQCYHMKGVMPPDEYHYEVDNSVYTNAIAQISLNFAIDLAARLQFPVPDEWKEVAKKIKIPLDPDRNYHPEFDGYEAGESVKQADVVLLGFPLTYPMSPEVRKNDLELYEPVTDPEGPAMTWSMFAVGWLELKEIQRAQSQLQKCFANISEPFKIWTESADGSGAVNFLTGMGGFLQAVLFGYTGFRLSKSCLNFDPACPEEIGTLKVTGVYYLGNKLNFTFGPEKITVELTSVCRAQSPALEAVLTASRQRFPLAKGKPISFANGAGRIQRTSSCWPF